MPASIDKSIGVLARHIRAILDRLDRHEDFLHRVNDYLSKERGSPQIGTLSPVQTQTFLYHIEITTVDAGAGTWEGLRQEALTTSSSQTIEVLSDRIVKGYSVGSLPSVGDKISAMWLGNVGEQAVYVEIADIDKFVIVRGTVTSSSSGQVTVGSLVVLPSWAKSPGNSIVALDVHGEDPSNGTAVEAIYDETSPTGWALLRAGSGSGGGGGGDTVEFVSVEKTSTQQEAGDPVPPLTLGGDDSYYWSGGLNSTGDVWIRAQEGQWKGRRFLPAHGSFMGKLYGNFDPNQADPENFPQSDLRPLYLIERPQMQEIVAKVTTKASAADWSAAEPVPSVDGRCTTFSKDHLGVLQEQDTDVEFENYSKSCIEVGAAVKLEHYENSLAVIDPVVGPAMVCGFETGATEGDGLSPVAQEVFEGKLLCWNGASPDVTSSYTQIEDIYIILPAAGDVQYPRHLKRMTAHWIGQYDAGSGDRDLYFATPPEEVRTRNFRLISRKREGESSATVMWTDDQLADYNGSTETVYDPHGTFHGLANARGVAEEVLDSENHDYRWQFIHLESPALHVIGTLGAEFTGSPVTLTVTSNFGPKWEAGAPNAAEITSTIHSQLDSGTEVLAVRKDPNVDPILYEVEEIRQTGTGSMPDAGCGLEYADATTLQADVVTLAGIGIKYSTSSTECDHADDETGTYCCLYVDLGCGLRYNSSDPDVIEVDVDTLAGKGISVGTNAQDCEGADVGIDGNNCCLYVDIGCGLKWDTTDPDKIVVDVDALAGDGLISSLASGDCQDAGIDGTYCCLKVNVGCGLQIVDDEVQVNNSDLAGPGLSPYGECGLEADVDENYFTIVNNKITINFNALCDWIKASCSEEIEVVTGCESLKVVGGELKANFTTRNVLILQDNGAGQDSPCGAPVSPTCM